MNSSQLASYGIVLIVVLLVLWIRTRRSSNPRPIRRNGIGMLIPVIVLLFVFALSLSSLMNIPDHPFVMPAAWEILCAAVLGAALGSIMLYHTGYEKREDGLVYSTPNKNFKYVLIAVIVIRIGLAQYFHGLDYTELSFLTMVLAFLYIGVWRIGSFLKYRSARGA